MRLAAGNSIRRESGWLADQALGGGFNMDRGEIGQRAAGSAVSADREASAACHENGAGDVAGAAGAQG
ncbi:hypothetical protein [Streptomyces sp. NPDC001621]|uniref:hypothetical protein n=1 Tax=Streptomyces sp. NPDC001621 TaxID=3364594 RepID=UPI0036C844CE